MAIKGYSEYLSEAPVSSIVQNDSQVGKLKQMLSQTGTTEDALEDQLEKVYDSVMPELEKRKKKFDKFIKKHIPKKGISHKPKIFTGIKPFESVISKIMKRGKRVERVGDFVRGAILFDTNEQVEDYVDDLRRKERSRILDYEMKDRGNDPEFGYYGTHHFDININGLVTELQVMTKKLWQYKKAAHKIYNRYRDSPKKPTRFDKYFSKKLFDLGNRPAMEADNRADELEQAYPFIFESVDWWPSHDDDGIDTVDDDL